MSVTDANVVLEGRLPGKSRGSWLVTGRQFESRWGRHKSLLRLTIADASSSALGPVHPLTKSSKQVYLQCRYTEEIMVVRVQKWGNSLALRLPKPVALDARLEEGSVIDLELFYASGTLELDRSVQKTLRNVLLPPLPPLSEPPCWMPR